MVFACALNRDRKHVIFRCYVGNKCTYKQHRFHFKLKDVTKYERRFLYCIKRNKKEISLKYFVSTVSQN